MVAAAVAIAPNKVKVLLAACEPYHPAMQSIELQTQLLGMPAPFPKRPDMRPVLPASNCTPPARSMPNSARRTNRRTSRDSLESPANMRDLTVTASANWNAAPPAPTLADERGLVCFGCVC